MKIFHLQNGDVLGACLDDQTRTYSSNQIEVTVDTDHTVLANIQNGWKYTYLNSVLEVAVGGKPATVVAAEATAVAVGVNKTKATVATTVAAQDRAAIDLVLAENGINKAPQAVVTPQEVAAAQGDLAAANAGNDAAVQQAAWIKYHMLLEGITPK